MKILAIDIGATKMRYGVFDKRLKEFNIIRTPKNKKAFLTALQLIAKAYQHKVSGIGICFPGIVDSTTGKILNLPNISFLNGINIFATLKKYSKNIQIDNDAKCYLRAEIAFGAARKYINALLVAIGTGIGGAIMINGKIYYGQGAAGEIGHIIINNNKSLETLAAGRTAITHRSKDFIRVGNYLGIGLANLVNILNPEAIIISGGFGQEQAKHFLPTAKSVMKKYIVSPHAKNTPVILGQLGAEAAVIGVGLLF